MSSTATWSPTTATAREPVDTQRRYRVTSPNWWVPSVPSSNWPTDRLQGTKPVRRRVRPATESTQPHHRRENFSPPSRPALRAASGRPPARQRHDGHRGTGLTLHAPRSTTTQLVRVHSRRPREPD